MLQNNTDVFHNSCSPKRKNIHRMIPLILLSKTGKPDLCYSQKKGDEGSTNYATSLE